MTVKKEILENIKKQILEEFGDADWFRGCGIGTRDSETKEKVVFINLIANDIETFVKISKIENSHLIVIKVVNVKVQTTTPNTD